MSNINTIKQPVYGLLYTHHRVPDAVFKLVLDSIKLTGLPEENLLISAHYQDNRFPPRARRKFFTPRHPGTNIGNEWMAMIYQQMIAGLEILPSDAWVLTLEHDVAYPIGYLETMRDAMIDPTVVYYYTNLRHLDIRPGGQPHFWASDPNGTRTLQSCCGGNVTTLLSHARRDLVNYLQGTLRADFELGINDRWQGVYCEQCVLDIRQGSNTSNVGYDKTIHHETSTLPYWGNADHLKRRLVFPN